MLKDKQEEGKIKATENAIEEIKQRFGEGAIMKFGEIKKLKDLKKSDFEEVKERLIGLRQISKEKCDSTMVDLLQEEIGGNSKEYYNYEENINKVALGDVKKLSQLKGYSFVALVPE